MSTPTLFWLGIAILTFLVGYLIAFVRERLRSITREKMAGQVALKQSRAAIRGQLTEQLVPMLENFPYDLGDARFLGKPIDYVIFNGLSSDNVTDIVFLEVKSGASTLTSRERSVRDAIQAGRVSWADYRLPAAVPAEAS